MRVVVALALLAASSPVAAVAAQQDVAVTPAERRVCTRIELRGASRLAYQRVCKTPTEWRNQLGPDWRQILSGQAPDSSMDEVSTQSRDTVGTAGGGMGDRSFGRPGGGTSGPQ